MVKRQKRGLYTKQTKEIKITMVKIIVFYFVFIIMIESCKVDYKVGNLIDLGYPIETPLRSKVIRRYMDTLIQKRGYNVPQKWEGFNKLVDIDSIYHKRIYFRNEPEEMYLISTGGMLVLSDVYNPKIIKSSWVADTANMPKNEELRIKKRFQNEILDTIESLARRDGLPDSAIYK